LGASAVFFGLALIRHLSFHSAAYDLGFFDQVLWNASHGRGLQSSFLSYNFFGEHFEPALLFFVPLYRVAPSPLWLLGAQSLALGLAVVPLHAIARRLLASVVLRLRESAGMAAPWLAVGAYLLQLGVARSINADFHTEALGVPFVFLAILLAMRGRWRLFALSSIALLLTKEDGVLVAIAVGALAWLLTRAPVSLVPVVVGTVYGAVVVLWIMPALRAGAPGDLIERYAYLGSTPGQVALHVFTRPGIWIGQVVNSPAPMALLVMLAAVGFLPLLRPAALAIALLPLIPALLSSYPYQAGLRLQYGLVAVPFLVIAALLGWQRTSLAAVGLALIAGAALTWFSMAPILPSLFTDLTGLQRAGAVDGILERIPPDAQVSASSGLLPHLSERRAISEFPAGSGAGWVVIDNANAPSQQSLSSGYRGAVARLATAGYRIEAQSSGVTLWRLGP
jgi:uncharacterized membrane protein